MTRLADLSWRRFSALVPSWGGLGALLGGLGALLGRSWGGLGRSWVVLEAVLAALGSLLVVLGAVLGRLGSVLCLSSVVFGALGASWGGFCAAGGAKNIDFPYVFQYFLQNLYFE